MSSRSDGLALNNDRTDIFVTRRNSARESNVVSCLPSPSPPPPGQIPKSVIEISTEGRLRSQLTGCFRVARDWFTGKSQSVSPKTSSSEQTVEESSCTPNPEDIFVIHTNSSRLDEQRSSTPTRERSPPTESREFLVHDEKSVVCSSTCLQRVRTWFNRKWHSCGLIYPASNCVIELTEVNTDTPMFSDSNVDGRQPSQVENSSSRCHAESYLAAICRSMRNCVIAKHQYIAAHLESAFDWSVLQAWNIAAYITCSVPYRLELNDEGNYTLKSHLLQQVFWIIQMLFVVAGLFRRLVVLLRDSHLDQPDPFEYMKTANALVTILATLIFLKVITTGNSWTSLLQIHENFKSNNNTNLPQLHSKKIGLISVVFIISYICTMAIIDIVIQVYMYYREFDLSPAAITQTFACFSKQTYLWKNQNECGEDVLLYLSELPPAEVICGVLGMLTFISEYLLRQNLTLIILSCSITLIIPAWYATKESFAATGIYQLTAKHSLMTNLSADISAYIGCIMTIQMTSVAFTLPITIKLIFIDTDALVIRMLIFVFTSLVSFFVASASSLMIDEIEDEFTDPHNIDELPTNPVAATAFFHKMFRQSIGIGYRGLFVVNFRFIFWYLGILGTFTKVLYETTKGNV